MTRLFFSAYAAACFSFLCSLIRDWATITHASYAQQLFDMLYFCSLAAGFAINAVTLGAHAPTKKFVLVAILASVTVMMGLGALVLNKSWPILFLAAFVMVMWIIGAIASRSQLQVGNIFRGRIRDAVSSLVIGALAFYNVNIYATLAIGACGGTIWALWVSRHELQNFFSHTDVVKLNLSHAKIVAYSNLSTTTIFLWALYFNNYQSKLFGLEPILAVRIAMYVFQTLSIGSVVLVARTQLVFNGLKRSSLGVVFGGLGVGLAMSAINPSMGLLFMPIMAALSNYAAIIYMRNL